MSSRVVDEGYWKEPLDLTIPMTFEGQFYKHFHQHIRPLDSPTPQTSFPQYAQLPAELQLRVLQLCDASTLFQLMHTSRHLRTEAKKLFFSDQETWYRQELNHLRERGTPGETIYDVDFLSHIEQLDIACLQTSDNWASEDAREKHPDVSDDEFIDLSMPHILARMRDFWQTVLDLCPRLKRVRLTHDSRFCHQAHPVNEWDARLAKVCPPGIQVSIYIPERDDELTTPRRKKLCWRLRTGLEGPTTTPQPEQLHTSPGTIVMPPQKPHRGRVGDFIKSQNLWVEYNAQRFLETRRMAAVEKHHFDGRCEPFGCAVPGCDVRFEQPEQYTTHVLSTGHGSDDAPPEPFKALFAENDERIRRLREKQTAACVEFWDWYGEFETEQYTRAQKELKEQLESDVLYKQDKPVEEHGLLRWMSAVYNESY